MKGTLIALLMLSSSVFASNKCKDKAVEAVSAFGKLNQFPQVAVEEVTSGRVRMELGMPIVDYSITIKEGSFLKVKTAETPEGECAVLALGFHGYVK
jgi:hypothetical protein